MHSIYKTNILWFIILFIFIFIWIIILIGRWINYKILFQPSWNMIWTPDHELYEDLYLTQDDFSGKAYSKKDKNKLKREFINIWYFKPYNNEKVVLYCHGNNDNNSYRDYVVDICRRFHLNLLLLDYRGYGKSDGRPTSEGVINDAKTAYFFLLKNYNPNDIIIWGESLGGAAAIRVAAECKCHKLILLSTFSSITDIINNMKINKLAKSPLKLMSTMIWDQINSKKWISKVKCPITIIHSKEDDLIPFKNAKILFNSISHSNKKLLSIAGTHSSPLLNKDDLLQIYNFVHTDNQYNPDNNDLDNILSRIANL